nr:PREDICTED: uncharacterized protein LOC103370733 [Stegastes partitus]
MKLFMEEKDKDYPELSDLKWIMDLAFLVDMLCHLDRLNLSLQVWRRLQHVTSYRRPSPPAEANRDLANNLNSFYCRFERDTFTPLPLHSPPLTHNTTTPTTAVTPQTAPQTAPVTLTVREEEVSCLFQRQNIRKAPGPDGVSPSCLKACADQLAPVCTRTLNRSLEQCEVPSTFRRSTVILVPKKSSITGLNDYRPVALTSVVMKSLDRLVLRSIVGPLLDPLQFAYRANRSADDPVNLGLHYILQHLEGPGSYVRILFMDFSSAFNTIIPGILSTKLSLLSSSPVSAVESFKLLGTTVTQDLKWEKNIHCILKKAQQRMYFLRQLRRHGLPQELLIQFYTAVIEAVLLVQCSNPGISAVPINVPADTVKLRLEKTLITKVPRAAFYNLSELRFLWLNYNSITSIHPSSFVNLKAIRELRLDGNLLTSFPWEGLRDMPLLQTLGLHNNRLSNLPAHASLFLPNITYLDLSSNRTTRRTSLHDNPWLCDCQISMLMSLSMSLGSPVVLVDKLLMCSRSLGQLGMLLTQAELSRCMRPSVQPAATRVISPLGSNVILRCDATGYPTPTLTWIKTAAYTVLQESPRVGVRWSIISLNGLSYKDAGEYRCQARNMAGISEAPIKLKVMGVTRLSFSKKKSLKTSSRSSSKHKKPYQDPAATITPSVKENQINTPLFNNKAQKADNLSKVFKLDKDVKLRKMNVTGAKEKTKTTVKSMLEFYGNSSNT